MVVPFGHPRFGSRRRRARRSPRPEPRRIPLEQVDWILFPSEGLPAREQTTDDAESEVGCSVVQATDLTGSRLTGRLLRVEQGTVWLEHPAVTEPVPLPMATLAAIAGTASPAEPPTLSGRIGRLACGQESVWGCLVSGAGAGEANAGSDGSPAAAIRWQPLGSLLLLVDDIAQVLHLAAQLPAGQWAQPAHKTITLRRR
jgi:hypothetical protein